jgi:ABC-type sugar transport system ATPase subunit
VYETASGDDQDYVASNDSLLVLKDVRKTFGSVKALKDLSFRLTKGECLVVLGPSGAGKTTALKVIAGLEKPDSGVIQFRNRIINNLEPKDRNMAMVFETYALYPHVSVYENLASPLRALKFDADKMREAVGEIAEILHITPYLSRKPGFLSGGQRQRVALGRALVKPADLYLMDEPIAHLDAKLRFQMIGEFKHLQETLKISIIYVTHDWREAMSLGNHVVVLNEGSVEQFGTPAEAFGKPVNTFVATIIGDPPMNLIPGAIEGESGSSVFKGDKFACALRESLEPGEAFLGIRPSRIRLGTESENNAKVEVYSSGKHGMNTVVAFRMGEGIYKTELKESVRFMIGESIPIKLELKGACVFNEKRELMKVLEG